MLNKIFGLAVHGWNAVTGLFEAVDKTNDARNALKVEDQHTQAFIDLIAKLEEVRVLAETQDTNTDELESKLDDVVTALNTLDLNTDGLEAAIAALNAVAGDIDLNTDGLEQAIADLITELQSQQTNALTDAELRQTIDDKDLATGAKQDAQTALLNTLADAIGQNDPRPDMVPASLAIGEEWRSTDSPPAGYDGWVDIRNIGNYLLLIAGLGEFVTVELEWSSDGATPNGQTTEIANDPTPAGAFTYNVYLALNNVVAPSGTHFRVHIVNGATAQDPPAYVVLAGQGKFPYIPLLGLGENLSFITRVIPTISALAGLDDNDNFVKIGVDAARRLRTMEKAFTTQSMSKFTESIRDDATSIFSRNEGVEAVAALIDVESVNGTVFHDPIEGQVVFSTGDDVGNTIYCHDSETVLYEAGHTIRAEQTIQLSRLPIGDDDVRWGSGESDGVGDVFNGIGWGYDADGLYVWRRKNGVDELLIHATSVAGDIGDPTNFGFNRDKLNGANPTRFYDRTGPQAINLLDGKGTIFLQQYEWLGKAPPDFMVMSPYGEFIAAHREEFPNNGTGTTVPEPNMALFVRAYNASGTNLEVRSGSWRAGLYTGRLGMTARLPSGRFGDVQMDEDGHLYGHITKFDPNVDLDGLPNNNCSQVVVGPNPVLYQTQLSDCRSIKIVVDNSDVQTFYGFVNTLTPLFKSCRIKNGETAFDWTGGDIYLLTGGSATVGTQKLSGDTAGGTATDPSNALGSDDVDVAIMSAGETLTVSGFTFAFSGSFDTIAAVRIGIEAAKEANQFQTVQHIGQATGTAGNVAAVSTTSVIGDPTYAYLLSVSWRNTAVTITGVTNSGTDLNWIPVGAPVVNGDCVTAVYRPTQVPSADFIPTVVFSGSATNSAVVCTFSSGVDLSDPIYSSEGISFSGTSYADELPDIANGLLVVSAGIGRRDHTAGSGSTEIAEPATGSGPNDASIAVAVRELVDTDTAAYSGTISGSVDGGVIAVVLRPAPAIDPEVTVEYTAGGDPGTTSGNEVLDSEVDDIYPMEVTGDFEWTVGLLNDIEVTLTGVDVGNADALIDHVFVEVEETTDGATTRVYIHELGGDDA